MNNNAWPQLPIERWEPTRDTLTLWLQVVGKIRIARTPLLNHWWNSPLYITARGLTTSLMPDEPGRSFSIDFDLLHHRVDINTTQGENAGFALEPMTVQDFYQRFTGEMEGLGLATEIWPMPVELPDAIAMPTDTVHSAYDAEAVTAFWRMLVEMERVFDIFRARFVGKSSPVHFFWGAFDLRPPAFRGVPRHPTPAAPRTVARTSCTRRTRTKSAAPATGRAAKVRAFSTPTPTRSRTAFAPPTSAPGPIRRKAGRVCAALHDGAHRIRPRRGAARLLAAHL